MGRFVEVLIVVVLLGIFAAIFAAIFVPIFTQSSATPEEQAEMAEEDRKELAEAISAETGEDWKDVQVGDLIRFENKAIRLIVVIHNDRLMLRSGQPNAPDYPFVSHHFSGSETLIKRGPDPDNPNPDYLIALDEFIRQSLGLRK